MNDEIRIYLMIFAAIASLAMAGCGKQSDEQSTLASKVKQLSLDFENAYGISNTREGEERLKEIEKKKKELKSFYTNREVRGWKCFIDSSIPVDIAKRFKDPFYSINRNGLAYQYLDCQSGVDYKKFHSSVAASIMSKSKSLEIYTIRLMYTKEFADKIGKLYPNDILTFSGITAADDGLYGMVINKNSYSLTVYSTSIELTPYK